MIYGVGINDLPRGWTKADEWNHRVYEVWLHMIQRCYDKKIHEKFPTYKNCYCCERWLTLSNFVEDIKLIDNYELWLNHPNQRISLDKDIKSNGQCKKYSIENCMFVSASENTSEAVKEAWKNKSEEELAERSRKISEANEGEKNPKARKVVSVDPLTKEIVFTWRYVKQATDFYGISKSTLIYYLKGKSKKGRMYNGFLWYYAEQWEQLNK